jgi:hypothetical protein
MAYLYSPDRIDGARQNPAEYRPVRRLLASKVDAVAVGGAVWITMIYRP